MPIAATLLNNLKHHTTPGAIPYLQCLSASTRHTSFTSSTFPASTVLLHSCQFQRNDRENNILPGSYNGMVLETSKLYEFVVYNVQISRSLCLTASGSYAANSSSSVFSSTINEILAGSTVGSIILYPLP